MKIALILFFQRKDTSDFIPWHFSYFKDILVHEGHDVDIIDNQIKEYSINELVDIVVRNKYELVGTGGIGTVYNDLKSFSTLLRQKNRSVLIVVGGQIVADYEFILKKIPIDVIVYGEGEKTLPKIVTAHIGNQSFSTVPGVAFRESGHVIKTPPE